MIEVKIEKSKGDQGEAGASGGILGINPQSGAYVLVLSDNGKLIKMTGGSAQSVTVPPNSSVAFPISPPASILIQQYGAGVVTISPGSGVTINAVAGKLKTGGQFATVSLIQIAVNEWNLIGNLTD
jgi:hypothetical protein